MARSPDEAALLTELERLDPPQRVAFAVSCAERLFRHYTAVNDRDDADVTTMRHALDRLHAVVAGTGSMALSEAEALAARCLALVPDEDEAPVDPVVPEQNAFAAVVYSLRCFMSGSAQDAVWAARQGYEAADFLAATELDIDLNAPGAERNLLNHPAVQRELAAQAADLARARATGTSA